MSRAGEASDRAVQFIIAREEEGWTEADQAELEAWLAASDGNRAAYWRLKHSWDQADRIIALGYSSAADDAGATSDSSESGRAPWLIPAAAAAAFAAFAVTGYGLSDGWRERAPLVATRQFATPTGARKVIELTDGSRVELNTASRVRAAVTDERREFWLDQGEAYFQVTRRGGQPFIVHAGSRKVTVLGTRFSVRRAGDEVSVAVLEGRVRVDQLDGTRSVGSTIVGGGDIARMSGSATLVISRSEQRIANSLAWREGMLHFDQMRLADVAAEFNRYNPRPIVVTDARTGDMRIGGMFPATDPDAFARLLRDAYGLKVEDRPEAIRISS
jgi:transmembrane sensor